jgi:hypothetical protein
MVAAARDDGPRPSSLGTKGTLQIRRSGISTFHDHPHPNVHPLNPPGCSSHGKPRFAARTTRRALAAQTRSSCTVASYRSQGRAGQRSALHLTEERRRKSMYLYIAFRRKCHGTGRYLLPGPLATVIRVSRGPLRSCHSG